MRDFVRIGPYDYLSLDPIDFGPPPEWQTPHAPEQEVRQYLNGNQQVVTVKPCWCPLPVNHPLHGGIAPRDPLRTTYCNRIT